LSTALERKSLEVEGPEGKRETDLVIANPIRVWDHYEERVLIDSYKEPELASS
jgi:hypothetical protein